jgi:hypothetical protein
MKRHWLIVRNLWASLDPTTLHWGADGGREPLVDLLGIPKNVRRPAGYLTSLRRRASSRSLAPDRRRKAEAERMALLSAFKDCAWAAIYSGWELEEHRDRKAELDRRKSAHDLVVAEHAGDTELATRRRIEELRKLEAGYPTDPRDRRRSWVGWWSN